MPNKQAQSNIQPGSNSALTQGYGNVTDQTVSNDLTQTQVSIDGFSVNPQIQTSVQAGQNVGVAVGEGNVINQGVYNNADQFQSDFEVPAFSH